jgi:tetratricopeptide (TPR) repeat protein
LRSSALGDFGAALDYLHRSLALTAETGDNSADQLHHTAVHRDAGRPQEALRYAGQALTAARESGYRRFEADALNVRGTVHLAFGDHARAIADHTTARALAEAFEGVHPVAEAHLGLAAAHQLLGRPGPALEHAQESLAAARAGGLRRLEKRILDRFEAIDRLPILGAI